VNAEASIDHTRQLPGVTRPGGIGPNTRRRCAPTLIVIARPRLAGHVGRLSANGRDCIASTVHSDCCPPHHSHRSPWLIRSPDTSSRWTGSRFLLPRRPRRLRRRIRARDSRQACWPTPRSSRRSSRCCRFSSRFRRRRGSCSRATWSTCSRTSCCSCRSDFCTRWCGRTRARPCSVFASSRCSPVRRSNRCSYSR